MNELIHKSATELISLIKSKKNSPEEVCAAFLKRIEEWEHAIQAWVQTDKKIVLEEARHIGARIQNENFSGALLGIPVGVKDIYNTAQFPTEMGSQIWKGFTPGNDARVVFNLRYAGGIVMGKTTTSEFAVHEPTKTRNPHNLECGPGTSSAGSAAAVAAGMIPLALGSQTGGSIIRPASYCGVYGYKPTFGLIPRTGVLKTTDTLDTLGWFARCLDDIQLLFEVLRVDGLNYPIVNERVKKENLTSPIKIGFFKGPHWKHASEEAQKLFSGTLTDLEKNKEFSVSEFHLPDFQAIFEAHERIYCKALSYYFRAEERNTRDHISPVLLDMLDRGEDIDETTYRNDVERQAELTHACDQNWSHDVVITLSAGAEVPVGLNSPDRLDTCKVWTYLGLPVMNVPLYTTKSGRPLGLQIMGKKYSDYKVFNIAQKIAALYEREKVPIVTPQEAKVPTHG